MAKVKKEDVEDVKPTRSSGRIMARKASQAHEDKKVVIKPAQVKRTKKSAIDRMSSLPAEALREISTHLRSYKVSKRSGKFKRSVPLSRALRTFQQIILYKEVVIASESMLYLFARSVVEGNLGHHVRKLSLEMKDYWKDVKKENEDVDLAQLVPLLAGLITLRVCGANDSSYGSFTTGITIPMITGNFKLLSNLTLSMDDLTHLLDLLQLKHLKKVKLMTEPGCGLDASGESEEEEAKSELTAAGDDAVEETLLALTTLSITNSTSHPIVLSFIRQVSAKQVIFTDKSDLLPALASIHSSIQHLELEGEADLDIAHLSRFTMLSGLSLSGDQIDVEEDFFPSLFTTFEKTLHYLVLGQAFQLRAYGLIEGLEKAGDIFATCEVNHGKSNQRSQGIGIYRDLPWDQDMCDYEAIIEMRDIAKKRGFDFDGTSLDEALMIEEAMRMEREPFWQGSESDGENSGSDREGRGRGGIYYNTG